MASLLYTWRPFVYMLYGVIKADDTGKAPENCRWTKQALQPLTWLQAFLNAQSGSLVRRLSLDSFLRKGDSVCVTTDASPYGLGAVLEINGAISQWFSCTINTTDIQVLSLNNPPTSADQQSLEALAALVALRHWWHIWRYNRVTLTLRTDNIATLTMCARMQPHGRTLGSFSAPLPSRHQLVNTPIGLVFGHAVTP